MADGREYYYQALEATPNLGYRPEVALLRLGLAELLLDHHPDERPEAIGHLDFRHIRVSRDEDAALAGARAGAPSEP